MTADPRFAPIDHHTAQLLVPRLVNDLVTAVDAAPLGTPIPTCPGWDIGKLIRHVGTVYRWVSEIVLTGATERLDTRTLQLDFPSGPTAEWVPWLRRSGDMVIDALDESESGTAMWCWGPDDRVDFWSRRMVHETAVHLVDVSMALGTDQVNGSTGVDPRIASDGVDEFLSNLPSVWQRHDPAPVVSPGSTIHLHATDAESAGGHPSEWTIRTRADGFDWGHEHQKGDVAVRGTAESLYLFVYGRLGADNELLEVFGDGDLLETWVGATAS